METPHKRKLFCFLYYSTEVEKMKDNNNETKIFLPELGKGVWAEKFFLREAGKPVKETDDQFFCPECGQKTRYQSWNRPYSCECGWIPFKEDNEIFIVHYPNRTVKIFDRLPTDKRAKELWGEVWAFAEALEITLERVTFNFGFEGKSGGVGEVSSICSGQSYEAYAQQVFFNGAQLGSYADWDKDGSWTVGDGSAASLIVENDQLVVCQGDYDREPGEWGEPHITHIVCQLSQIYYMGFSTTSGWEGQFYPLDEERKKWICVLHRSTGAVTIADLPF